MAITSGFFMSVNGDRKYNANSFAEYFATFIGNGVFPNPSSNLQVTANNDMTVSVNAGKAWMNGYILINDDDYILSIDVADGVLSRIDRAVVRYDVAGREIRLEVKKGTSASNPVAPTLQRDADAYEMALADVYVGKGIISITQANITDQRLNTALCGIVHGVVQQVDTTTLFNQYAVAFSEDRVQFQNDFNAWFSTLESILDANTAGNLLNMINDLQTQVSQHSAEYTSLKIDYNSYKTDNLQYSTYKSLPDENGIFTQLEYKRKDGSLIMKSVLSGGASPNYTTRTETEYEQNGITISSTKVYSITYEEDKVVSEVLQ